MTTKCVQNGFTLLELLVAIAVFAVLGVMSVGALTSVLRADDGIRAQQQRLAELQFAVGLIERDLSQAVLRPVRDAFGDPVAAVNARRGSLSFTRGGRPNPMGLKRSNLERVTYRRQGNALTRTGSPVLDAAPGEEPESTRLLDNVEDLRVRWLTAGGRWLEFWPPADGGIDTWPAAAEVRLSFPDRGTITRLIPMPEGPALATEPQS